MACADMENKKIQPADTGKTEGKGSHEGHRSRMRERYALQGLDEFQPHEVLEMLLYRSITRGNTNPIAHALLEQCGSFESVLEGNGVVPGVGDKTCEMLRKTDAGLQKELQDILLQGDTADRGQLYTAAVWFLRRYPDQVLLVVCDRKGKPEDIGTVMCSDLRSLTEMLLSLAEEDAICHIAGMHCEEPMGSLRHGDTNGRLGLLLSLTDRWIPTWL